MPRVPCSDELDRYWGTTTVQTYAAIDRVVAARVIREITGLRRDRVDGIRELDDLDRRAEEVER